MSGSICRGCGEEILPWQYMTEAPNYCKECYIIMDMDRFKWFDRSTHEIESEEEENET